MSGNSLVLCLRAATRAAHHRLDHHPLLAPLVREDTDIAAYGDALAALHGPHAALEGAVGDAVAAYAPAYDFRPRLPALEADLAALGRFPPPLAEALAPAAAAAELTGYLYVLEGSRLGAEVIARRLAEALPAGISRRFHAAAEAPEQWQAFWRFADAACPPDHHGRAAAAALTAFEVFARHLDRCLAFA